MDHVGLVWLQVHAKARKMRRISKDDLFQWGFVGLLHACRNYDPTLGWAFSTFARKCIHGQMVKAFEELDFCPRGVRQSRLRTGEFIPTTLQFGDDDVDPRKFTDAGPGPSGEMEQEQKLAFVHELVESLPAREARVIRARIFEGRKMREIAAAMHITYQRVQQIEKSAMEKLRRRCGVDPLKVKTSLRRFID